MSTAGEFAEKVVLVTGAGKGIGRSIAVMLAGHGASVVAMSRSAEDLKALEAEIGSRSIHVDLADAEATRAAARSALPVDCLVNCAGTTTLEPFLDVTVEAFDHLIAVNTRAPMIVAQEYARDRVGRGVGGAIVNVSSMSSFIGFADHAACLPRSGNAWRTCSPRSSALRARSSWPWTLPRPGKLHSGTMIGCPSAS